MLALILGSSGYLGYRFSHGRFLQQVDSLLLQRQQLARLEELRTQLKSTQTTALTQEAAAQPQWRWPKQAEHHQLSLTLQRQQPQKTLNMSVTGTATNVRQFTLQEAQLLTQSASPLNQLQLLTWQQQGTGNVRLHWQVSQTPTDQSLTSWRQQPVVTVSTCQQPAVTVPSDLPSMRQYQLSAIVNSRTKTASVAYFSQAGEPTLKVQAGDWLTDPLAQVTAVDWHGVTIRIWQQRQSCWQSQQHFLRLEQPQ